MYRRGRRPAGLTIGILAGTAVDTQMGIDLMREHGFDAVGDIISNDPVGNSAMQILGGSDLQDLMTDKIRRLRTQYHAEAVCIYCNSISTALDLAGLRKNVGIPVVTPLEAYRDVGKTYDVIGVLGANCQAIAGIEKVLVGVNGKARVIGVGLLPLVTAIESGKAPRDIVRELGIGPLMEFLSLSGAEVLVLGCTHFPYMKGELKDVSDIPVFDPAEFMLARLQQMADSCGQRLHGE